MKHVGNSIYLAKGMCVDCLVREIPKNEGYDCDVIIKDLTGKKMDCRNFASKNFKEFSKEYIEKLKTKAEDTWEKQ